jgi:hypothetical protein
MSEQTLQPIPARATAITLEKGDVLVLEYEHRISADTLSPSASIGESVPGR